MTVRVGSWPGPGFQGNDFIDIFCRALTQAGVKVVGLQDVEDIPIGSIDILQIHWAEKIFWNKGGVAAFVAALTFLRSIRRLKDQGVVIAWLVHNLQPHESSRNRQILWRWYSWQLARMTDAVISLSPATLPLIEGKFPFPKKVQKLALRHPRYDSSGKSPDRLTARAQWGVPRQCRSIVFAGVVRPYKGVDTLARTVGELGPAGYHLTIAGGTAPESYREEIEKISAQYDNIRFFPGRTSPETFENLIASADFVILPFIDTLHSGSIVHALSLGRPVVTPYTPYAKDLQELIGSQWIRLYAPPLSTETIKQLDALPEGKPDLDCLSPDQFGETLAAFYQSIVRVPHK